MGGSMEVIFSFDQSVKSDSYDYTLKFDVRSKALTANKARFEKYLKPQESHRIPISDLIEMENIVVCSTSNNRWTEKNLLHDKGDGFSKARETPLGWLVED